MSVANALQTSCTLSKTSELRNVSAGMPQIYKLPALPVRRRYFWRSALVNMLLIGNVAALAIQSLLLRRYPLYSVLLCVIAELFWVKRSLQLAESLEMQCVSEVNKI
ncbi:Uncharacterised protein [BD1-7 clade bacterium]|uniref:Uncharacterized protein n=1 Tax=BD1-7 clade bacterium TaxID=2029982 RepID=A0A5S9NNC3_9GAMM|nr:Uncharacterised protein [BD1-7 clade bacterium]CAA0094873.1 Uncharacterised protein [BD1-7 clade bacterium]